MRSSNALSARTIVLCLALTSIGAVWMAALRGSHAAFPLRGEGHKLRVREGALAREIAASGGRLIGDYGSFQFFDVDGPTAESFRQREGAELSDEENLIRLNAGSLDTSSETVQSQSVFAQAAGEGSQGGQGEKRLQLVQFAGPIKPEWREALARTGVRIVNYIPHNAYLVFGDESSLETLRKWTARTPAVQWHGEYQPNFKFAPGIVREAQGEKALFAIQVVADDESNPATFGLIRSLKTASLKHQFRAGTFINQIVELPLTAASVLAARGDVVSIARYDIPRRFDERQDMIVAGNLNGALPAAGDYLDFLASQGLTQAQFTASGFAVNITDSGVDNATTSPTHFGLYVGGNRVSASRFVYSRLVGTPSGPGSTLRGCDGHGNINAHLIAGFVPAGAPFNAFPHADAAGFRYGLGVAPFVRVGASVIFDGSESLLGDYTFPDFTELESRAWNDGARISSNSWGATAAGEYTIDSQAFDYLVRDAQPDGAPFPAPGNQENAIVFAAGNSGPIAQSVGAPGTAKNVITVGASENVHLFGGADRCTTADVEADNANDMSLFTSRGPTADGRKKPDLVAPGTHITGGAFQVANPPAEGQADPCFTANGICGGPLPSRNFFPVGQQFYTASTGTSHSTPAVAGAAALLRQRFLNAGLDAPSPAMLKSVLMNSARYLSGSDANDTLWSNVQGMGAVNLQSAFGLFSTPTMLRDQLAADLFTATGQVRTYNGTIGGDPSQPFRVTLAWTDEPGSTASDSFVNNLDLEVTIGGQTYKGNAFSGAFSTPGGAFDPKNNVESVFIPAGMTGAFTVRVTAANIAGDGVPNNAAALDQDFALAVFNMAEGVQAQMSVTGTALTAESCQPGNSAIDPGEMVTVELTLQNVGRAATADLTATLLATGGVSAPGAPRNYGAVPRFGSATRPFSFRANGVCGGQVTLTLQLQDGAVGLGAAGIALTLGTTVVQMYPFSNTTPITINASGAASPYPSVMNVSGVAGAVNRVSVTLSGLSHANPDDLDIMLVSPGGQKVLLMSDAGGSGDLANVNLTFDDGNPALSNSNPIVSGSYSPTNFGAGDVFSVPAPVGPYPDPQALAAFNGISGAEVNGAWKLFIVDDLAGNGGVLGSWTLNLTATAPSCCTPPQCPAIAVNPDQIPAGTAGAAYSQSFTQSGGSGAIAFALNGTLPGGMSFANATLAGTPAQAGSFPITVTATDQNGCTGSRDYMLTIASPPANPGLRFYPLARPVRLLDTRAGQSGCYTPGAPIAGSTSRTQPARGVCDGLTIPANATAITGNITTVQSGGGYLTLYPSDAAQPTVANSNYNPNEILNNVFTVGLGASDGAFKIFVTTNTDVVVDVTGYYAPPGAANSGGLYFHPLPRPVRLLETRAGFTGCYAPGAPLPGNADWTQQATGACAGLTIPAAAKAIVGNATTVNPLGSGSQYFTLFPADAARPLVASSNYLPGQIMNAPFTVGLSPGGAFKIYPTTQTDLVIDVSGYYSAEAVDVNGAGLLFYPLSRPVRLLETRPGFGGCYTPGAPLAANSTRTQPARGVCDGLTIPANAAGIIGNSTVVQPTGVGYLTFWPSGAAQPTVAASNYTAGQIFNRHFIVGLGSADGAFKIFTLAGTQLVIDLSGYFAP